MGSAVMRSFIRMRWAKEQNIDYLFEEDISLEVPGERIYRAMCKFVWSRKVHLPPMGGSLDTILLLCYSQLLSDEDRRREHYELYDLITKINLHNSMVDAAATDKEGREAGRIKAQDMDRLMTLLYNVQKITNPLAMKPQSYASDELQDQYEANKELFDVPWVIQK
jgi:hypothetical protein